MHPSFLINDVHTAIEVFTGVMVDYIVGTGQSAQILTESEHDMMYDSGERSDVHGNHRMQSLSRTFSTTLSLRTRWSTRQVISQACARIPL